MDTPLATLHIAALAIALSGGLVLWNNRKRIWGFLSKIDRATIALLVLILLVGSYLRFYAVPHEHRLFFDEPLYMELGKKILLTGNADTCEAYDYGGWDCKSYTKPIGYPYILSFFFLFFGLGSQAAIGASIFFSLASIIGMFFAATAIFRSQLVGLFAAAIAATNPIHLLWSATATSDVTSFFLLTATAGATFVAARTLQAETALLAIFLLFFSAFTRFENILASIPLAALFFAESKNKLNWQRAKNLAAPVGAACAVLSIALLAQIQAALENSINYFCEGAGLCRSLLSVENAFENWPSFNPMALFFEPAAQSFFGALLAIGLWAMCRGRVRNPAFLALWLAAFYAIVLLYWGAPQDRKIIAMQFSAFIIMAIGAKEACERIGSLSPSKLGKIAPAAMVFAIIALNINIASQIGAFDKGVDFYQTAAANDLNNLLPANALVVAEHPIIITSASAYQSISTQFFLNDSAIYLRAKSEDAGLFYFEDKYCTEYQRIKSSPNLTEFYQQELSDALEKNSRCQKMHESFSLKKLAEYGQKPSRIYIYEITEMIGKQ